VSRKKPLYCQFRSVSVSGGHECIAMISQDDGTLVGEGGCEVTID
jgi:hypothetical protein